MCAIEHMTITMPAHMAAVVKEAVDTDDYCCISEDGFIRLACAVHSTPQGSQIAV